MKAITILITALLISTGASASDLRKACNMGKADIADRGSFLEMLRTYDGYCSAVGVDIVPASYKGAIQ